MVQEIARIADLERAALRLRVARLRLERDAAILRPLRYLVDAPRRRDRQAHALLSFFRRLRGPRPDLQARGRATRLLRGSRPALHPGRRVKATLVVDLPSTRGHYVDTHTMALESLTACAGLFICRSSRRNIKRSTI